MGDRVVGVITARGGSRSIPRKNVLELGGHPLIAWTIAAAAASERLDRVIVSTDDQEIASVCRSYGAEVPFIRPAELAADETPDLPVFEHALAYLRASGTSPSILVHLRPTSPFRPRGCIDRAISVLEADEGADSVRSVVPATQNPFKMWSVSDGALTPLVPPPVPEAYNLPRQALPEVWWHAGHVDALRVRCITQAGSMSGSRILPLFIDSGYAVDLDTPEDWAFAEALLAQGHIHVDEPGDRA